MLVVLDASVLVSAFLTPGGECAGILRSILAGQVRLAIDARIYGEYREVLARPKFGLDAEHTRVVLEYLYREAVKTNATPLRRPFPDPDDRVFCEVALAARADYLITGNKRHFPAALCAPVKVVLPREFLSDYQSMSNP